MCFIVQDADPATVSQMYRYSYPAVFVLFVLLAIGYFLKMVVDRWEQSVRDEVYLIGERLHNHGERRLPQAVSSPTTTATTETSNTGPEPLALLEIGQAVENQLQHMDRSVQSHRAAEGTQA